MIEHLKDWAEKVSSTKKGLDKNMFDDVVKYTITKLGKYGYAKTRVWLCENYVKGEGHQMVGVVLLRNNSKQVMDKLWSLNKAKCKK